MSVSAFYEKNNFVSYYLPPTLRAIRNGIVQISEAQEKVHEVATLLRPTASLPGTLRSLNSSLESTATNMRQYDFNATETGTMICADLCQCFTNIIPA